MSIKEWFERYIKSDLPSLKAAKEMLEANNEVDYNQMTGLDLAIVTMERNPDYGEMYADQKKKREKGSYVKVD